MQKKPTQIKIIICGNAEASIKEPFSVKCYKTIWKGSQWNRDREQWLSFSSSRRRMSEQKHFHCRCAECEPTHSNALHPVRGFSNHRQVNDTTCQFTQGSIGCLADAKFHNSSPWHCETLRHRFKTPPPHQTHTNRNAGVGMQTFSFLKFNANVWRSPCWQDKCLTVWQTSH